MKKHKLDSGKTLLYFLDHIKCGKTLSEKVIKKTDLTHGFFSVILPSDAKLDRLFNFDEGGVIPPVPCKKEYYHIKGTPEEFHPNKIITMDHECSEFIADFLSKSRNNLAIIENYMLDPQSPYVEIKNVRMIPFGSEVYYFLNQNNSVGEIYETLRKSSQVWHFLSVLTHLPVVPNVLTDTAIDQICENIKYIIAGAYDGEAYIYWKKRVQKG